MDDDPVISASADRRNAEDEIAALWYAWGRVDQALAEHPDRIGVTDVVEVDVFAFSEYYGRLAQRPGARPSIQDAYRRYLKGER